MNRIRVTVEDLQGPSSHAFEADGVFAILLADGDASVVSSCMGSAEIVFNLVRALVDCSADFTDGPANHSRLLRLCASLLERVASRVDGCPDRGRIAEELDEFLNG